VTARRHGATLKTPEREAFVSADHAHDGVEELPWVDLAAADLKARLVAA
jgi:hypothetical protein